MFRVAVTVVGETTTRFVTGISAPMPVTAKVPVRLVPVKVTLTLVRRAPEVGTIDVSVGGGGAVTVNVTGLEVPPGVETVTFLAVVAAVLVMVKVAVTVVSLTTTRLLTATPGSRHVDQEGAGQVGSGKRDRNSRSTQTGVGNDGCEGGRGGVAQELDCTGIHCVIGFPWQSVEVQRRRIGEVCRRGCRGDEVDDRRAGRRSVVGERLAGDGLFSANGPQLILIQLLPSSTVAAGVRLKIGLGTVASEMPGGVW